MQNNLEAILELAYAPLTIYEFDMFRNDPEISAFLSSADIYVIAKRPLPIMEVIDGASNGFRISVHLENTDNCVELMMCQSDNPNLFGTGLTGIKRHSNLTNNSDELFHALTLYGEDDRFIMHANFDRLMQLSANHTINLRIKGTFDPFLTYEVLYVGQCSDEHIYKRFKNHHALLEILVRENIVPENYDKANELLILPFKIGGDIISVIDGNTSSEDFARAMTNCFDFEYRNIVHDCEKALIKALSPKYNKTLFLNYPKSKDGLYNKGLKSVTYKIGETLVLKYANGHNIYGDASGINCSQIVIFNNESFNIFT